MKRTGIAQEKKIKIEQMGFHEIKKNKTKIQNQQQTSVQPREDSSEERICRMGEKSLLVVSRTEA